MAEPKPVRAVSSLSSKSKTIEFQVCGQKVAVKASESEPDMLDQVVELVAIKIKEAERRGKDLAPHYTMLLALLDLAQDYVTSKKRTSEFKQSIHEKISRLTTLIESPTRSSGATR